MFPQHGVQFLSTTLGGVLETGFNEGLVESWFWSTRQGLYFRSSTNEDSSIRNLPQYACDDVIPAKTAKTNTLSMNLVML